MRVGCWREGGGREGGSEGEVLQGGGGGGGGKGGQCMLGEWVALCLCLIP